MTDFTFKDDDSDDDMLYHTYNLLNDTGVSLWTLQIVSPSKFPTDNTVNCAKSLSGVCGIELVTMTSVNAPLPNRSTAGGENTACVAQAYTSLAPSVRHNSAPASKVPPVSIISSNMTQTFPSTSPIKFITCALLCPVRLLSMMAKGASANFLANARARGTPPTSGLTTTTSSGWKSFEVK
ncbi:unnamed protein product [Bathycoccus prasinos]